MKKTLSKITLLLLVVQQLSMAATNPLLDPNKKSSTIIDIGYNKETIPVAVNIPKTLMDIPALSKEIDKKILLKQRDIVTKDCLIDDNGFETCPQAMETCTGNLIPSAGNSEAHTGHIEISAINRGFNISEETTACNDHYLSAMFVHVPSAKLIQVLYLNASPSLSLGANCSGVKYTTAKFTNVNISNGGPISVSIDSSGAGCSNNSANKTLSSMPVSDRELSGEELFNLAITKGVVNSAGTKMSSTDLSFYDYNVALCNAGGAQYPKVTVKSSTVIYECPNSNYTLVNTDKCKIDYTYYTYSCPSTEGELNSDITWADANPAGAWVGPFQAGGDCLGIGIADGGVCNSSTAPSNNCVRTNYTCPTDPTKDCAKVSTEDPIGTNIFSGYQYSPGTSTAHSKTITSSFICDNGSTYDSTKQACVTNKQYVCLKEGYTYNALAGECIADAVCNDYWNSETNKCESIPLIECPTGFTYNTRTMNCEKKQDCVTGTLNESSGLCESEAYCGNEPGYNYDLATKKCYKNIDYTELLYQPIKPSSTDYRDKIATVTPSTAYGISSYVAGSAIFGGEIANYQVNVGNLNYKFYAPVAGNYTFQYQVDDMGEVYIDGVLIIATTNWTDFRSVSVYMSLGEHNIYMTGRDTGGGPRGQSLLIKNGSGTIIWNNRTGQPLVNVTNFVCPTSFEENGTVGNCKKEYCEPYPQYQLVNHMCYFDSNNYNICQSGYTYNETYGVCYISNGRENLATGFYEKEPSCKSGGTFNEDTRLCELAPTCFNGTNDTVNRLCTINEINKCLDPAVATNGLDSIACSTTLDYSGCLETLNCSSNPNSSECLACSVPGPLNSTCLVQRIAGYDTVCANSNICSGGGVQISVGGEAKCKSTKQINCPAGFFEDPNDTNKCVGEGKCPVGYISKGTHCELTYNWATYECPADWQGPVEPGADCNASCNEDGCWCNMPNSPVNNCKKLTTISTGGSYTTIEKRNLEKHIIKGSSFSPEDLGEFRNMDCGEDCAFYINKITGNGNNICFEKKNGEKKCLPVDDCYFSGEISPSIKNPKDFIKTLSLIDQHTLRSNYFVKLNSVGTPNLCRIGSFNPTTRTCEGTMPLNSWSIEGNPTSGDWSLRTMDGEEEFFQSRNLLNTMYMYPTPLSNQYTIKGQINPRINHKNSIGLVFGWQSDSSMYLIDWGSQSYWCQYYGNCGLNLHGMSYGALNLIKVNSSAESYGTYMRNNSDLLATNTEPDWTPATWQDIKAEVNGGNLKVYIGNTKYLDYTLPGGQVFPEGKVGFFNLSTPEVSYRRFVVENMAADCPPDSFLDPEDGICRVYECKPGYIIDYEAKICVPAITSTCRMNGHAGWTGRENGISSLGAGGLKTTVALLNATGTASYDSSNNWSGFNIATMAVKLTDGNWYVVDKVLNSAGTEIKRNKPTFVRTLNKAYYQILDSTNTLNCTIDGVQLRGQGYCGNNIKMTLPGTKMGILAFSDIESLSGLDTVTSDNSFNLNVSVGSNSFDYKGTGKKTVQDLIGLPNLVLEPKYDTFLSNKIDFWDSFIDKDIGFLEFIREVKNEDRADNFVPENVTPYDMLSKGFTVNEYMPEANQVLFVKPTKTTSAECTNYAAQIGGTMVGISSFAANTASFALSRGVGELGSCAILTTDINKAFDFINFAIRKNIYNGGFDYKCSPFTCLGNECSVATCPTENIGGTNMYNGVVTAAQTVTYVGTILPDSLKPSDPIVCTDNVCDAKLPYVPQCGREVGCDNRDNVTTDTANDKCLQFYCDNGGVLNTETNTCQVFKCPFGTTENAQGKCVK